MYLNMERNLNIKDLNVHLTMNIGMLGPVSDGKSTCVYQLTGTKTQRFSSEQTRNITIKPGYANIKIWQDGKKYYSTNSKEKKYFKDDKECRLVNHFSFVDCPGHQELILTMLSSIRLMNGVIFVVGANESVYKKPQLIQHIAAVKIAGIKKIIICLNKIDLVDIETVRERYNELCIVLRKYDIKPQAIIPTSFNKKIGLNWLLDAIMEHFTEPTDNQEKGYFLATRSFDVNKPGSDWSEYKGGVIGGSLINGTFKMGDKIEIRPGICGNNNGTLISQPIKTEILSLETDGNSLSSIYPGGLIGIGTTVDPFYSSKDQLSGNIIGIEGTLPSVYSKLKLKYTITEDFDGNWKPKTKDIVNLQIASMAISSEITEFNKKSITAILSRPACVDKDAMIIISHKEEGIMKIVAIATLISGDIIVD